ncbi:coiled-coil domain-containing protein [Legionella septentrionalis]|uniref:hypothetical protein n=1 Tax=Legionella septentrionalis TaxID=2498109 RepID=UPI000F8CD2E9|nr:hypothetical protein [Legionella septentrionalis]RUR11050.1 hypothetical protein ELY14_02995 [Legionella septentrionalis]
MFSLHDIQLRYAQKQQEIKLIRNEIKSAVNAILELEGKSHFPETLNPLMSQAEKVSHHKAENDDDISQLMAAAGEALAIIPEEIEKIKKAIAENGNEISELQLLKNKKQQLLTANEEEISLVKNKLKNLVSPVAPSSFEQFIADKNPGFLKSLVLFFIPQKFITAAQAKYDAVEMYESTKISFEHSIESLEKRSVALKKQSDTLTSEISTAEKQIKAAPVQIEKLELLEKQIGTLKTACEKLPLEQSLDNSAEKNANKNDDDELFSNFQPF